MNGSTKFHLLGILIPFQEKLLVPIPTDFWIVICHVFCYLVPFVQFKKHKPNRGTHHKFKGCTISTCNYSFNQLEILQSAGPFAFYMITFGTLAITGRIKKVLSAPVLAL